MKNETNLCLCFAVLAVSAFVLDGHITHPILIKSVFIFDIIITPYIIINILWHERYNIWNFIKSFPKNRKIEFMFIYLTIIITIMFMMVDPDCFLIEEDICLSPDESDMGICKIDVSYEYYIAVLIFIIIIWIINLALCLSKNA